MGLRDFFFFLLLSRFEYVFDLSFCALAWRRAEEFEPASDSSEDEQSHAAVSSPSPSRERPAGEEGGGGRARTEKAKKSKGQAEEDKGEACERTPVSEGASQQKEKKKSVTVSGMFSI